MLKPFFPKHRDLKALESREVEEKRCLRWIFHESLQSKRTPRNLKEETGGIGWLQSERTGGPPLNFFLLNVSTAFLSAEKESRQLRTQS
jgi:hypothetical protein